MPTADENALFGNIITRRDVELAIVSFLRLWVPTYIAEMERQAGIPPQTIPVPPDPGLSYRGGLDFDTWEQAWSPVYIVSVQPAAGVAPERTSGEGIYLVQFDVHVACNFVMTHEAKSLADADGLEFEDSARQYADMLGMAGLAAIIQHGGMGRWPDGTTIAVKTIMSQYPRASFPYPDERRVVRSEFAVQAFVANVVAEADGPASPFSNPYAEPGDWPLVDDLGIVIDAIPLDQQVP